MSFRNFRQFFKFIVQENQVRNNQFLSLLSIIKQHSSIKKRLIDNFTRQAVNFNVITQLKTLIRNQGAKERQNNFFKSDDNRRANSGSRKQRGFNLTNPNKKGKNNKNENQYITGIDQSTMFALIGHFLFISIKGESFIKNKQKKREHERVQQFIPESSKMIGETINSSEIRHDILFI